MKFIFNNLIILLFSIIFYSCSTDEKIIIQENYNYNNCESNTAKYIPKYPLDRFKNEVEKYEVTDSKELQSKIIFYGSSTMRLWNPFLKKHFPNLPIIGHGFGGATFPELIKYNDRLVLKYNPKIVVLYCENDQFVTPSKQAQQVSDDFCELIYKINENLQDVKIVYIAMKHSKSRDYKWNEMQEADKYIKNLENTYHNFTFIDLNKFIQTNNQVIDESCFESDNLHLNEKGYQKWADTLGTILEKMYY